MPQPLSVILDFDGTVTLEDLGLYVTTTFGRAPDVVAAATAAFERGEITVEEIYSVEVDTLRAEDHDAMQKAAMEAAKVREGFTDFIAFCRDRDIPVEIASSGMKFYIDALLKRLGASHVPIAAPVLTFNEEGRGIHVFDEGVVGCGMTAMCKCERVWRQRRQGRSVLFVGDGSSDHCAALQADHVVARHILARYCEDEDIHFTPFENFFEVQEMVEQLITGTAPIH